MLWNNPVNQSNIRVEYAALVASGVSKSAAADNVQSQLEEILADLLAEGMTAAGARISALMQWWDAERPA